jgi:hypothetical protein
MKLKEWLMQFSAECAAMVVGTGIIALIGWLLSLLSL